MKIRKIAFGVSSVLLILAIMCVVSWRGAYNDRLLALSADTRPSDQSAGAMAGASGSGQAEQVAVESDELSDLYARVDAAGMDVIRLQDAYRDLHERLGESENVDETLAILSEVKPLHDGLGAYFASESFRSGWYSWSEDYDGRIEWSFVRCLDYSGDNPAVMWICEDADGTILYYVVAKYDDASGTFVDYRKGLTYMGAVMAGYTTSVMDSDPDDREYAEKEQAFFESVAGMLRRSGADASADVVLGTEGGSAG